VLAFPVRQASDITYTIATGCGRKRASFAQQSVTEITCIAKGVNYLFPEARTIIDIGGQDTKVIRIDEKGRVVEFEMNDKCAAGTGRFIEVMAKALSVDLDKIGDISLKHKKELAISSICTVFAESEVISLVSEGEELEDILYGIHKAIADRTMGLINRLGGVKKEVIMAGGVAKNAGVVKALEKIMDTQLKIHVEPQIVGALGAAIIALEKSQN
jgi:predicted CoA-substrate-specific enzyme activase